MKNLKTITFIDFEYGEVHTIQVPPSEDHIQDIKESLIDLLQERICEYAVFGFCCCKLTVHWPNDSTTDITFSDFNSLKQYYRCTIGR